MVIFLILNILVIIVIRLLIRVIRDIKVINIVLIFSVRCRLFLVLMAVVIIILVWCFCFGFVFMMFWVLFLLVFMGMMMLVISRLFGVVMKLVVSRYLILILICVYVVRIVLVMDVRLEVMIVNSCGLVMLVRQGWIMSGVLVWLIKILVVVLSDFICLVLSRMLRNRFIMCMIYCIILMWQSMDISVEKKIMIGRMFSVKLKFMDLLISGLNIILMLDVEKVSSWVMFLDSVDRMFCLVGR